MVTMLQIWLSQLLWPYTHSPKDKLSLGDGRQDYLAGRDMILNCPCVRDPRFWWAKDLSRWTTDLGPGSVFSGSDPYWVNKWVSEWVSEISELWPLFNLHNILTNYVFSMVAFIVACDRWLVIGGQNCRFQAKISISDRWPKSPIKPIILSTLYPGDLKWRNLRKKNTLMMRTINLNH